MSPRDSPCPFCGLCFVRLGPHLPRCSKREGRDYSAFLARKAVAPCARGVCSSCGRHFKRLDTHLWVSATCRVVASGEQRREEVSSTTPAPASLSMNSINQTPVATDIPSHHFKHPLRLPRSPEEWEDSCSLQLHCLCFRPSQQKTRTPVSVLGCMTSLLLDLGQGLPPDPRTSPSQSSSSTTEL